MSLDDLLVRPEWQRRAACRGQGTHLWFPPPGTEGIRIAALGRRICATCPVVAECEAAGEHERFGIWGGRGIKSRRARRRSA